MRLKILFLLGLLTFNSYALEELWPTDHELNSLVEMYGLDVELPDTVDYPVVLGHINKNNVPEGHQINDEKDVVGDMVKTIQAANVKEDELIFYDYGEKKEEKKPEKSDLTKLITKDKISKNVDKAIKRELNLPPPARKFPQKEITDYLSALDKMGQGPETLKTNSTTRLYAFETKLGQSIGEKLYNFEFVPGYDESATEIETGDGHIDVQKHLNSQRGIIHGRIVKRGFIRTKIDLLMEKRRGFLKVPLFEIDHLEKFLEKEKLRGHGGFILLNLEDDVVSVDIDANFEAKVYLDSSFKVVDEGLEKLVLFVGVPPGNVLLKILNDKKDIAQKIVHVVENELYFDHIKLIPGNLERIDLFEKKLLGKLESELNINGDDLTVFNTQFKGSNIGINTYEYYRPVISASGRKYFSLNHEGNEFFLGNWEQEKIEVPSNGFKNSVLEFLNIESLYKQCIVQINLNMPIHDFKAQGISDYDSVNIETYYLNSDGTFGEEINDLTEKVFIYGNFQGIINAKAIYEDGSSDFLQSYCSDSTYLIEQL